MFSYLIVNTISVLISLWLHTIESTVLTRTIIILSSSTSQSIMKTRTEMFCVTDIYSHRNSRLGLFQYCKDQLNVQEE